VLAIGASHRNATTAELGGLTHAAQRLKSRLRDRTLDPSDLLVSELAVLTTCNRVEVYAVAGHGAADAAVRALRGEVFAAADGATRGHWPYELWGADAVRHLCRVAVGLDSLVIGEHQITGQVARAFRDVVLRGDRPHVLDRLRLTARKAARRVRSETDLGRYPASVSSVAVDLARGRLGDLARCSALVVGAGKAGRLVCKTLRGSGVGSLTVVSRSMGRAVDVVQDVGGRVAPLDELPRLLTVVDLVVTATGAEGVLLDVSSVRSALAGRGHRSGPVLVIDLAMPGDVDPGVGELAGVELLTLDDLGSEVDRHLTLRRRAVGPAEAVVDEVVRDFVTGRPPLAVSPAG
jgi:glutamyl-tRNA reductase